MKKANQALEPVISGAPGGARRPLCEGLRLRLLTREATHWQLETLGSLGKGELFPSWKECEPVGFELRTATWLTTGCQHPGRERSTQAAWPPGAKALGWGPNHVSQLSMRDQGAGTHESPTPAPPAGPTLVLQKDPWGLRKTLVAELGWRIAWLPAPVFRQQQFSSGHPPIGSEFLSGLPIILAGGALIGGWPEENCWQKTGACSQVKEKSTARNFVQRAPREEASLSSSTSVSTSPDLLLLSGVLKVQKTKQQHSFFWYPGSIPTHHVSREGHAALRVRSRQWSLRHLPVRDSEAAGGSLWLTMVGENTEKLDPKEDKPEAKMADAWGKVKKVREPSGAGGTQRSGEGIPHHTSAAATAGSASLGRPWLPDSRAALGAGQSPSKACLRLGPPWVAGGLRGLGTLEAGAWSGRAHLGQARALLHACHPGAHQPGVGQDTCIVAMAMMQAFRTTPAALVSMGRRKGGSGRSEGFLLKGAALKSPGLFSQEALEERRSVYPVPRPVSWGKGAPGFALVLGTLWECDLDGEADLESLDPHDAELAAPVAPRAQRLCHGCAGGFRKAWCTGGQPASSPAIKSQSGELAGCLLRHKAFRKPPPRRRLSEGLVHRRTASLLVYQAPHWCPRPGKPPPEAFPAVGSAEPQRPGNGFLVGVAGGRGVCGVAKQEHRSADQRVPDAGLMAGERSCGSMSLSRRHIPCVPLPHQDQEQNRTSIRTDWAQTHGHFSACITLDGPQWSGSKPSERQAQWGQDERERLHTLLHPSGDVGLPVSAGSPQATRGTPSAKCPSIRPVAMTALITRGQTLNAEAAIDAHWSFKNKRHHGPGVNKPTLSFLQVGHRAHHHPGVTAHQIAANAMLSRPNGAKCSPQPSPVWKLSLCGHRVMTSRSNTRLPLPSNRLFKNKWHYGSGTHKPTFGFPQVGPRPHHHSRVTAHQIAANTAKIPWCKMRPTAQPSPETVAVGTRLRPFESIGTLTDGRGEKAPHRGGPVNPDFTGQEVQRVRRATGRRWMRCFSMSSSSLLSILCRVSVAS
ncbi:hypothetical protein QTO34_007607 [Cnephaeus nilssonii]|uniref:Uncharacterized protein n=1 Tax=Cnephaeus nilssonii TaxID=3371016 RepID=A0AA40HIM5_CNENI|nr:hypothetical protein QTO34_007607 [Eptesicus nilssonii]